MEVIVEAENYSIVGIYFLRPNQSILQMGLFQSKEIPNNQVVKRVIIEGYDEFSKNFVKKINF